MKNVLILKHEDGTEQEFEIAKATVTLGRSTANDISVPNPKASRFHAQIEVGSTGCTLIDLGSSNGTWLNEQRIENSPIQAGDVIRIGNSTLTYATAPIEEEADLTRIESEAELDQTMQTMAIPMTLNDTSAPRLAINTPTQTWELPLIGESITIGRQAGNDIVLDLDRISRKHARITRKGNSFVLEDLGSTNGTFISGRKLDQHTLQHGDVIKLGKAQLVFKDAFFQEELTMAGELTSMGRPGHRPVIFVPGMMGSQLWRGSEQVWPNVKLLFTNPEVLRLTDDSNLEPRGIVNEVVIVPNLIKQEQYNRLGDFFVEELGYERGKDYFEFAYDWRKDVRDSARRLAEQVEQLDIHQPITIIAHSLGTLVTRYYVEKLGGKRRVERIILLGGPHNGVPKAATSLLFGPDLLPFGLLGERLRKVLATFYTSYQILPTYICTLDQTGQRINMLEDQSWVSPEQLPYLRMASQFRKELGQRSSIPAVSIFGYGLKTVTGITIQRTLAGIWKKVEFENGPAGDSSIPEASAMLEGSEIHPVQQYHGTLFVDNDVKMRLKVELTRP